MKKKKKELTSFGQPCHVMSCHVMSCRLVVIRVPVILCDLCVTPCIWLQEQGSIADVLQSDLAKIESLVEEAVRQLSSAASASSVRPLDACEVMEAMNRHHLNELLPRIQEADTAFEQLCTHCIDCKVGKLGLH